MKQYRKKPVTIEAVQFDGLNPTEIKDFVGENCEVEIYDNGVTPPVARIVIHTLEGDMEVSKGDYVIKGVKGEFYPCKPDIFQQTYESAETQQEQPKVDLVAKLKHHLATTPKEQLEKEWKELEPWGNIGPTVQEFLYGKWQEVDLEKEIEEYWVATEWSKVITLGKFKAIARYFYGLGQLNSK